MKKEYKVDVEWKPFFLHPEWPPEGISLPPHIHECSTDTHKRLDNMAAEIGLPMVRLGKLPNSRLPLEASEYAREHGKHEEFHRAVFRKLYGKGQDISKWETLRAAAKEVGLDAEDMQSETKIGSYKDVVDTQTEKARVRGISAVPTYIINDKFAVVGAKPYEVFKSILRQLTEEYK